MLKANVNIGDVGQKLEFNRSRRTVSARVEK